MMVDPRELKAHPIMADMPMLPDEHPEMQALAAAMRSHGFWSDEPVKVVRAAGDGRERKPEEGGGYLIVDGRHRARAAVLADVAEIPVCVHEEDDVERLIVESVLHRRHMTQVLRCYMLYPVLNSHRANGLLKRVANLWAGTPGNRKNANVSPNQHNMIDRGNRTLQDALNFYRIETTTWHRARAIREAFAAHPKLRERFEMPFICGELSAEGVAKACGFLATDPKTGEALEKSRSQHDRFLFKALDQMEFHFGRWADVGRPQREAVVAKARTAVRGWPEELQQAIYEELCQSLAGR